MSTDIPQKIVYWNKVFRQMPFQAFAIYVFIAGNIAIFHS